MDSNRLLKLVYTFFTGLLIALFIGVGINTFYTEPKAPEMPAELQAYGKELNDEQLAKQRAWDATMTDHDKKLQPYNRNVSMLTFGAAIILLAISIIFEKRLQFIADDIMLGGLFTLVYSIGRGFASQNNSYVFVLISAGLAVVLYLGYRRFVQVGSPPKK